MIRRVTAQSSLTHQLVAAPIKYSFPRGSCCFGTNAAACNSATEEEGPSGTLFHEKPNIGAKMVGLTGEIQRTFGPRSNAEAALATGGAALAAHASFDPDYNRAQSWIRHHAVGSARLSPVLITGLTQSLAEAAFPQAICRAVKMKLLEPLIVGVPVTARITVETVSEGTKGEKGFDVVLNTKVTRVRDDAVIAVGTQELWIPDYLRM